MLASAGEQRRALLAEWEQVAAELDPAAEANEAELADIASLYARSLQAAREAASPTCSRADSCCPATWKVRRYCSSFPCPH
ncbi:hypothetical protein Q427_12320 [Halomonas sp. BC04]|nr:hypothetical protein Q427_12320 [Halomonas sp. BC04]